MAIDYNRKLSGGQMPAHYCHDDRFWIDMRLSHFGFEERSKLCAAYSKVYREAFDAQPIDYRKEGAGRGAANERLREYVKKKFMRKMG